MPRAVYPSDNPQELKPSITHFELMPMFYLHMCDGNGFVEDDEGLVLQDEATARKTAISGARDIMAGDVRRGELDLSSFIEVEDQNHQCCSP